jgi:hypothetical protein
MYYEGILSPNRFEVRCEDIMCQYRTSRKLFLDILDGMREYDDYFKAKLDATPKVGVSSYQKCSAAIRELAYRVPRDLVDEYVRLSESICIEAM